jgi:hypothetical protein
MPLHYQHGPIDVNLTFLLRAGSLGELVEDVEISLVLDLTNDSVLQRVSSWSVV